MYRSVSGWVAAAVHVAETYNILYSPNVTDIKPVEFRGSSLDDLRAFPMVTRREAGHQIDQVQHGQDPRRLEADEHSGSRCQRNPDSGCCQRFSDHLCGEVGGYRLVLHGFQKKTSKTIKPNLDLATRRYRDLRKELGR